MRSLDRRPVARLLIGLALGVCVQGCDKKDPIPPEVPPADLTGASDLAGAPDQAGELDLAAPTPDLAELPDLRGADLAPGPLKVTITLTFLEDYCGPVRPGKVVSTPPGIDCAVGGGTCTATFPAGTAVSLTAVPPVGAAFKSWNGGCTGNPCTPGPGTYTLTPVFTATHSLTLNVANNGGGGYVGVSPVGEAPGGTAWRMGTCGGTGTAICCALYAPGSSVTLTEMSGGNVAFRGWSGACSGTAHTCTVTVTGKMQVSASLPRF